MEVHIEWKKYGTLRDVAVFGEFKGEFGNDPPFFYATAVSGERYSKAFQVVQDWLRSFQIQKSIESRKKAKRLEDYIEWREFEKPLGQGNVNNPVLLYIGIASTPIVTRLEDFDAGVSIPLYFLNIPAMEIDVFIGHITGPSSAKGNYEDLEKSFIYKCQPPLNIHHKKTPPPRSHTFVHQGEGKILFNQK